MSGSRIPLPALDRLTAPQRQVADAVAAGRRGEIRGPVRVWLHSPELANRAQRLGEYLRWDTVLDARISELVILTTSRHYTCHYIWFNHVGLALKSGIDPDAIERIKNRQQPSFHRDDEATAFAFTRESLERNWVGDETLARARALFTDRGVIELGAIIAHYHSGAIALGLADIDLPDGSKTCLPP